MVYSLQNDGKHIRHKSFHYSKIIRKRIYYAEYPRIRAYYLCNSLLSEDAIFFFPGEAKLYLMSNFQIKVIFNLMLRSVLIYMHESSTMRCFIIFLKILWKLCTTFKYCYFQQEQINLRCKLFILSFMITRYFY